LDVDAGSFVGAWDTGWTYISLDLYILGSQRSNIYFEFTCLKM